LNKAGSPKKKMKEIKEEEEPKVPKVTPFNSYRPTFYFFQNPESIATEFRQEMDWELDEDPKPPQIDHFAANHLRLKKQAEYTSLIGSSPGKPKPEGIDLNEIDSDSDEGF